MGHAAKDMSSCRDPPFPTFHDLEEVYIVPTSIKRGSVFILPSFFDVMLVSNTMFTKNKSYTTSKKSAQIISEPSLLLHVISGIATKTFGNSHCCHRTWVFHPKKKHLFWMKASQPVGHPPSRLSVVASYSMHSRFG